MGTQARAWSRPAHRWDVALRGHFPWSHHPVTWAKAGMGEMVGKYIRVPASLSLRSDSCAPKEAEGGSLGRNSLSGARRETKRVWFLLGP